MDNQKVKKALEYLVDRHGPIDGRTRLLKLLYLADKAWAERRGRVYTEANYYRWNHGPFAREVMTALDWLDGIEIVQKAVPNGMGGTLFRYESGERSRLAGLSLDPEFAKLLDEAARRWGKVPLKNLLDHVYSDKRFIATTFGQPLLAG